MCALQRSFVTTSRSLRFFLNPTQTNQHAGNAKLLSVCRYTTMLPYGHLEICNKSDNALMMKCVNLKYPTDRIQIAIPIVKYDEIKNLPNHPEKWLIDVREPIELERTGAIPTAINIPRRNCLLSVQNSDAQHSPISLFPHFYEKIKNI